jgi:hypothetical protein
MATEGTKFQVNFKTADGTLINLYAATVTELETGLADLAMNSMNIKTTAAELGSVKASAPAVAAPTVASVAQAFNATPVAPAAPAGGGNTCAHGEMVFKSGTSTKGPWKGYMCPTPKGAADKCDPIFVR